jgi:hypothetical protein
LRSRRSRCAFGLVARRRRRLLKAAGGDDQSGITTADSADLSFVKVSITDGFQAGADVLSFAPAGGIAGSFNASTGELFLVGAASLASYQEVLRSVTFSNTSDNPTGDTRTITILANDGTVSQTIANNTVDVTAVNDGRPAAVSRERRGEQHHGTVVGALSDTDPDAGDSATTLLTTPAAAAISGSNLGWRTAACRFREQRVASGRGARHRRPLVRPADDRPDRRERGTAGPASRWHRSRSTAARI